MALSKIRLSFRIIKLKKSPILTKRFPHGRMQMNKFEFNFQNFADVWSKEQWKYVKKQARYAYLKSNQWSRKMRRRDWQTDFDNIGSFYFANRAFIAGASQNLPYSTLALLGELLSNSYFQQEIKEIIQENVIKFDGQFFKLDDPENQAKIRKALRSYKFQKADKSAA